MGNTGDSTYIPVLKEALKYNDQQVDAAIRWAIKKIEHNNTTEI